MAWNSAKSATDTFTRKDEQWKLLNRHAIEKSAAVICTVRLIWYPAKQLELPACFLQLASQAANLLLGLCKLYNTSCVDIHTYIPLFDLGCGLGRSSGVACCSSPSCSFPSRQAPLGNLPYTYTACLLSDDGALYPEGLAVMIFMACGLLLLLCSFLQCQARMMGRACRIIEETKLSFHFHTPLAASAKCLCLAS